LSLSNAYKEKRVAAGLITFYIVNLSNGITILSFSRNFALTVI